MPGWRWCHSKEEGNLGVKVEEEKVPGITAALGVKGVEEENVPVFRGSDLIRASSGRRMKAGQREKGQLSRPRSCSQMEEPRAGTAPPAPEPSCSSTLKDDLPVRKD